MSQSELLKKVITTFERNGIEYMLTGSVVSSIQGEPRSIESVNHGDMFNSITSPFERFLLL